MPTRTIPLSKQVQGVAPASGTVVLSLGPTRYGDEWQVTSEMVQNTTPSSSSNSPQAVMEIAGVPQAGTFTGVQDDAGKLATLRQGQVVKVTWTKCDPGSVCTLSLYGERTIDGG